MSVLERSCLSAAIITTVLALGSPARANDSVFGGAGADLVPLKETIVSMKREAIVLTSEGERWNVEADYWFENSGSSAVTLQVGFPEYRCNDSEEDCANVAFRNLVTRVNDAPAKMRTGSLRKDQNWAPYLGVVWLFDVEFAAGKTTHIRHSYSLASGASVMGDHFTTYVTRTGAVWAGKIGRAEFTFRIPGRTHTVSGAFTEPKSSADGRFFEAKLVHEDWEPEEDIHFSFSDAAFDFPVIADSVQKKSGLAPEERCPDFFGVATAAELQMCRNLVYALSGYTFRREALNRYFYESQGGWHLAPSPYDEEKKLWRRRLTQNPNFRSESLDTRALSFLKGREADLKLEPGTTSNAESLPATKAPLTTPTPEETKALALGARKEKSPTNSGAFAFPRAPSPEVVTPAKEAAKKSAPPSSGLCSYSPAQTRGSWLSYLVALVVSASRLRSRHRRLAPQGLPDSRSGAC